VRSAVVAILLVSALRLVIALGYPLTADETYYWVWSKHLAYGYTDHPPAVAWLIASSAWLGNSALAVRLPFIICEAVAAFAVGRAALALSEDPRAGTAATVAFLLIPQGRLAVGEALPDGPYLATWALALWLTAEAAKRASRRTMILLGLALGGALLSRFFGWAIVFGICAYALIPKPRTLWSNGLWIALLIAAALYAPFVVWNAAHAWSNFAFTFSNRQPLHGFSAQRIEIVTSLRFVLLAIVLWIVAFFTILRPRYALLAWTALPFPTCLAILSFFQTTESYWILGPLTSVCVGIGIAYTRQTAAWKRTLLIVAAIPAAYTITSALFVALPERAQAWTLHASHGALKGPFYSQAFAFAALADDVARLSSASSAAVITDRLEIASELTYHGVTASIIGGAPQVAQWAAWYGTNVPSRALLVTFNPAEQDVELSRRMHAAFERVSAHSLLRYRFAGTEGATFYVTFCERPRANAGFLLFGGPPARFDTLSAWALLIGGASGRRS